MAKNTPSNPDDECPDNLGPIDTPSSDTDDELDELLAVHGIIVSGPQPLDSGNPTKLQTDTVQTRSPAHLQKRTWPKWIADRRRVSSSLASPVKSLGGSASNQKVDIPEHYARIEAKLLERDHLADQVDREHRWKGRSKVTEDFAAIAELEAMLLKAYDVESGPRDDQSALNSGCTTSTPSREGAIKLAEHDNAPTTPARSDGSEYETVKDIEELITACERSWLGDQDALVSDPQLAPNGAPSTQASASGADEESQAFPIAVPELIEEVIAASQHMRWTRQAFDAYQNLRKIRTLARNLSRRVFGIEWETHSETPEVKKFPFFIKSCSSSSKGEVKAINEEWEISHQVHRERKIWAGEPTKPEMPAWNKLPAMRNRSLELQELVAGVRFASIAFPGQLSPQDWAHTIPGSDVLCMSIDLNNDAAHRFIAGEGGDIGKSLKRQLLRRLDRRGKHSEMTAAAVWTRPEGLSSCAVRVFIVFQDDSAGAAFDVELEDRNRRFWESLKKHRVQVSPSDMPLWVPRKQLASYVGLSDTELDARWDANETNWEVPSEIQEYTPTDGFPSKEDLARLSEHSHRKWARFTSRLGMPTWINSEFMKRVEDYFFFSQEHVRERDRLVAMRKKYPFDTHKFTKGKRQALVLAQLSELSPGDICVFKCSPAQFAALAVRDGAVLGEYCDSAHKAGRAKDLYETIRKEWV